MNVFQEGEEQNGFDATRKQYRQFLTLEQKMAVIDGVDKARRNGGNMLGQMQRLAARYGISTSTTYHIYQRRAETRAAFEYQMRGAAASESDEEASKRRLRNFLPLTEKIKVIEAVEKRRASGRRILFNQIGRLFGISTSCAFSTYTKRKQIWAQYQNYKEVCQVNYSTKPVEHADFDGMVVREGREEEEGEKEVSARDFSSCEPTTPSSLADSASSSETNGDLLLSSHTISTETITAMPPIVEAAGEWSSASSFTTSPSFSARNFSVNNRAFAIAALLGQNETPATDETTLKNVRSTEMFWTSPVFADLGQPPLRKIRFSP